MGKVGTLFCSCYSTTCYTFGKKKRLQHNATAFFPTCTVGFTALIGSTHSRTHCSNRFHSYGRTHRFFNTHGATGRSSPRRLAKCKLGYSVGAGKQLMKLLGFSVRSSGNKIVTADTSLDATLTIPQLYDIVNLCIRDSEA